MKRKIKFIVITLMTLAVIVLLILLIFISRNHTVYESDEISYSQEEVDELVLEAENKGKIEVLSQIRELFESGQSVISSLKILYPEYLIVASSGTYHWVDINEDLDMHNYNIDNVTVDEQTGEYKYVVDDNIISRKGIDVSSHQGDIDWKAVAEDGVEFAFIRAVYRGYGSGALVIDEKCLQNIAGAQAEGIEVGVYVFSQAITKEEVVEEADTTLALLEGVNLDLPIVYDVEKLTFNDARMNNLTVDERTDIALEFLQHVQDAGFSTMIYHNTEMGALLIDMTRLTDYDKWFAGYNREFYWPYDYSIWQYSEKGKVNGINGDVDLDLWLKDI